MSVCTAMLAMVVGASPGVAAERFGAPLPKAAFVKQAEDQDAYGQPVGVALYRSEQAYDVVRRWYRRRFAKTRRVRVTENRESIKPGYVIDPQDPRTSVPVVRVLNLDYTASWAAVFVRPMPEGTLIAVLQRKPPPEVSGDTPPKGFEIPRSVFEIETFPALERRR